MLPHLRHDEAIIGLSIKDVKYKFPYLIGNLHPNIIILVLQNFINIILYKI